MHLRQGVLAAKLSKDAVLLERLPRSGWDLVNIAQIQIAPYEHFYPLAWQSNLLYAKRPGLQGYRWYEVYLTRGRSGQLLGFRDFKLEELDEVLRGRSPQGFFKGRRLLLAFGPVEIDDENENAFHNRWAEMFAQLSQGRLGVLAKAPFKWPPKFI